MPLTFSMSAHRTYREDHAEDRANVLTSDRKLLKSSASDTTTGITRYPGIGNGAQQKQPDLSR